MDEKSENLMIPSQFHSFETGRPFENCLECNCYLLNGKEYLIEKCVRAYADYKAVDTVFDFALCIDCATQMRSELSKESLARMDEYFKNNVQKKFASLGPDQDLLSTCLIKDTPVEKLTEYQIYAHCKGDRLSGVVPPYLISGAAIEELIPLLSKKTSEFLDGFYRRHFSPDPSLFEPTPKLILI